MSSDYCAVIAANRFGLGAKPGDLGRIGSDARGWLDVQLQGAAPTLTAGGLRSSADILSDAAAIRDELQTQRRNTTAAAATATADAEATAAAAPRRTSPGLLRAHQA